jgi:hypothetical protein
METATAAPAVDPDEPGATPRPSAVTPTESHTYAAKVASDDDLDQVCEGWSYAKAPKVSTSSLNPIDFRVNDTMINTYRDSDTPDDLPSFGSRARENAWTDTSPAKIRLVACIELADVGAKLKTCRFNDPKPDTVTMKQGVYHVRLIEVATGRKLIDKQIKGQDKQCPYVSLIYADKTIYSEMSGPTLYTLFRHYVEN